MSYYSYIFEIVGTAFYYSRGIGQDLLDHPSVSTHKLPTPLKLHDIYLASPLLAHSPGYRQQFLKGSLHYRMT